ncbi:Centromere protein mis12 [Mycena venus]|uniref:Centromere protein mis12 n=1 Tax=Mycena venus TaxID=2733690 RepID=A0A8H6YTE4_9AGAR|nr:Centromere protein mis12 [Mycena venus]
MNIAATSPTLISPQLLTEALGFSPELLLSDIVNVANQAVQDGVNGVGDFLQQRHPQHGIIDNTQEIEQGLLMFQTLLEFHADVAFDFFEAWALRNVFAVPADLPLVLPHHEHLDPLTNTPQREEELMNEVEALRTAVENRRRIKRALILAHRKKDAELWRARRLLDKLMEYQSIAAAKSLPAAVQSLQKSVATLSGLKQTTIAAPGELHAREVGERKWDTGRAGYISWAVSKLLAKAGQNGGNAHLPTVANAEMFRRAEAAVKEVQTEVESDCDTQMDA